jgi:hypothetical protein
VLAVRLVEMANRVPTDPPPFLLATPTADDGTLDAAVLLDRLREYERTGTGVSPLDFDQALLRVRPGTGKEPVFSPVGVHEERLAAWLARGGPPAPGERRIVDPPAPSGRPANRSWRRRVLVATDEMPPLGEEFSGPFRALGRTAAVDAALTLAATGVLDTGALGRDAAELVTLRGLKPNRLADALRSLARTGAYATAWSVAAAALPALLADLVAAAVECADGCGAGTPIPEIGRAGRRENLSHNWSASCRPISARFSTSTTATPAPRRAVTRAATADVGFSLAQRRHRGRCC